MLLRFYLGDIYDALLSIYGNKDIDNLIKDGTTEY